MPKLKPRTKNSPVVCVETERREITITDVTYQTLDINLLNKYFPSIYKDVMQNRKVRLKRKGSKE